MEKETCKKCEMIFTNAIIENWNIKDFIDWDIWTLDLDICIKCLSRITKRYEN